MREYKSKDNKKSARRDVSRVRGRKIEGDQHGGQLGQGHGGQAQEAVAQPMSSFHLQMQQPKLYSNLTFQKHRLIQLSLLSLLLPCATHHFLPLSALFHLFSFICLSYSCHISSAPNLFLSIAPSRYIPLYYSPSLCIFFSW